MDFVFEIFNQEAALILAAFWVVISIPTVLKKSNNLKLINLFIELHNTTLQMS